MRPLYAAAVSAVLLVASPAATYGSSAQLSTTAQRESVNVTIYNSSLALVHDRRRLSLPAGEDSIAWRDVSAQIDASSALLTDVNGGGLRVLEQNYNYDLLDPGALLNKYVGRTVIVVHPARFAGERDTRERAKILSTNGGIVLQYADRIETQVRGYIIYPNASYALKDRPTLELQVASSSPGPRLLDLSYLTGGLSWSVDYAASLSPDESHMRLDGTVTLSNTSGVPYEDARVQLVVGNVNAPAPAMDTLRTISSVRSTAYAPAQQESFFEYHLYTLPRPTSILDRQTKQVALLSARDVPVRKTLELRGSPAYYQSAQADLGDKIPVGTYISFENRGGDLGIPLPAGVVRVYKADSRGLSEFAGADNIDHTPRFETVRLFLGNSFDVTARKKQTDFQAGGNECATTSSYEIVISNAKDVPQHVLVVEPIPGAWQILSESAPHVKSSAATATWNISVPARGRTALTYTARTTWC